MYTGLNYDQLQSEIASYTAQSLQSMSGLVPRGSSVSPVNFSERIYRVIRGEVPRNHVLLRALDRAQLLMTTQSDWEVKI